MDTITLVTIIRALIDAGQTNDMISATIDAMGAGFNPPDTATVQALETAADEPEALATVPARRNVGNRPSVKYHVVPGVTAARLAQRFQPDTRPLQVASVILANNRAGITKREVLAAVAKIDPNVTNGAIMSAIHGLQTAGVVRSVAIAGARPAVPQRPAATPVRVPVRGKR